MQMNKYKNRDIDTHKRIKTRKTTTQAGKNIIPL